MELLNSIVIYSVELEQEKRELRALDLTEEEIEGYIEFYWDSWFPPVNRRRD